ncbi:MAG TPA: N-acetylmuramoyl-L-alanine amidase [Armatimonadota bacterium]|nr:N-acetylmuramoyl-L-alanine amidase [Armatimonadota bacterium]HOS43118.1 N-acetylmuramoyl-L-alanine amidase [Armatimonadota bacterium]
MMSSRRARACGACLVLLLLASAASAAHVVSAPSRHYTKAAARRVDTVVIHYLSGINVDRSRWSEPALCLEILRRYRVSAHYLIDRAGTVYALVDERDIAWHAGGSIMPAPDNRRGVNRFSIGIELIATHTSGFTDAQYAALATLVRGIQRRHPIRHLVGHDQISGRRAVQLGLRKDVKPDPGPRFDWPRFRRMVA